MLPTLLCNFANASKSMYKVTRKGCDSVPTDDSNGSTDNCIVNPNGDLLTEAHESIHSEKLLKPCHSAVQLPLYSNEDERPADYHAAINTPNRNKQKNVRYGTDLEYDATTNCNTFLTIF